jgi:Peptidase family M41
MKTPRKNPTKRAQATAYHEAAHAVIAWTLKRTFRYVTIVPTDGALGHVLLRPWGKHTDPNDRIDGRTLKLFESDILIALAGDLAVKRLTGRMGGGGGRDVHDAFHLASFLWEEPEVVDQYFNFMLTRIGVMIGHEWTWTAIEALAAALLEHKRIAYRTARKIIAEADRAYWTSIASGGEQQH